MTAEVRESPEAEPNTVQRSTGPSVSRRGSAQRKGDRREQAILTAAQALLREQPLDRITVDALASAAGISRSSFYFYFDSKRAVLTTLLTGIVTQAAASADTGWLAGTGPQVELLREAMTASVRLWRAQGPLLRQAMLIEDPDPALSAFRTRILDGYVRRASARIRRDQQAGLCPIGPQTPEQLAAMTYYVELTTLAGATTGPDIDSSPEADAHLVEALTNIRLRMLYGNVLDLN